jgi:hypothetical protein
MWFNNPKDDRGNARVDFVYGNVPPATQDYRDGFIQPGDGQSEYYLDGHATVAEYGDLSVYSVVGTKPSQWLGGGDNHLFQLGGWNGYPENIPGAGITFETTGYDWVNGTRPSVVMPNVIGKTLDQAQRELRNLGVAADVTREFLSTNTNPYDMTNVNVSTGNNVLQFGNVIYIYQDPEAPITFDFYTDPTSGVHWDGRPWLGKEAEGLVVGTYDYPGFSLVPIDADEPEEYLYGKWLAWSLLVVTNDPTKDQWSWWN